MKKFSLVLSSFICWSFAFAQVQVGLFGGIANYQGDLSDKPFLSPNDAFGLTGAYQLTSRINLRAGFTYGKVSGADSLNKKDLRFRNLSFESAISELSLVGEFNTFDLTIKRWSPYVFAGIAIYHFNPYTYDATGGKVFLKPLSTEGQGLAGYQSKSYALTQLAIPFGGGVKFNLNDRFRIAAEIGLRKLFTDHLDDVSGNYADASDLLSARGQTAVDLAFRGDEVQGSTAVYPSKGEQRGSPKYKDFYYLTGIHLTYSLQQGNGRPGSGKAASRRGSLDCPRIF